MNQTPELPNVSLVSASNTPFSRPRFLRQSFCLAWNACAAIAVALLFWAGTTVAQSSSKDAPPPMVPPIQASPSLPVSSPPQQSDPNEQPQSSSVPTAFEAISPGSTAEVKQSKRILWIIPNYRAVRADTHLPPLSLKNKFWLATQDSFDYSSFISAGMLAGVSQANKSYLEFGQAPKATAATTGMRWPTRPLETI